jgi:6-phosphogluconolactonase (cycloisomerase 2 family)
MSQTRRLFHLVSLLVAIGLTLSCSRNSLTPACSGCQFVYSTTNSGEILSFPVSTSGVLGTPTSVSGPANSKGIIAVSPGALQLYVYVSDPGNSAIRSYTVSASDGNLSPAPFGPYAVSSTPGELAAFGTTLYAASSAGSIFAFTVNSDGSLTAVSGSPFSAGSGLSHLAVVPSQAVTNTTFLYASNSADPNGSISAFTISSSGALAQVTGSPFPTGANAGPEGFYDGGNILYVALKNANAVAALTINADGSLTPIAQSPFPAGQGTSSLSGADGFLFATNNLDGTISSYSMDPVSGILTQVNGSPFAAAVPSGDVLYDNGKLFLPVAASNTINGFLPDLSSGAVNSLSGSPFPVGAGPLALTMAGFPVIDPP